MKTIKTLFLVVLGIVILILGLIFSLANMTPVTLKFYHYETVPMPLWFLVIVCVLLGALFTVFLIFLDLYRGARKLSKMKKELKGLEKNLDSLKIENFSLEEERNRLKREMNNKTASDTKVSESNDEKNEQEIS